MNGYTCYICLKQESDVQHSIQAKPDARKIITNNLIHSHTCMYVCNLAIRASSLSRYQSAKIWGKALIAPKQLLPKIKTTIQ